MRCSKIEISNIPVTSTITRPMLLFFWIPCWIDRKMMKYTNNIFTGSKERLAWSPFKNIPVSVRWENDSLIQKYSRSVSSIRYASQNAICKNGRVLMPVKMYKRRLNLHKSVRMGTIVVWTTIYEAFYHSLLARGNWSGGTVFSLNCSTIMKLTKYFQENKYRLWENTRSSS